MSDTKRIAVYPGSFDPLTKGHLDIITRAAQLFDELVVAVGVARGKDTLFSADQRVELIEKTCADLAGVRAGKFSGLAVTYAQQVGAVALVRGLRTSADYEYELQMARMNRALAPGLETIFIPTNPEFSHISSSLAKEIASHGGDVSLLVPPSVAGPLADTKSAKS